MGSRVDAVGGSQPRPLLWCDLDADLIRYRPCDLALQLQDISQLALVGFPPRMRISRRLNQLGGHPYVPV